ncbi:Deoxyuridine 5'-triphosphate nucleotidohydrolase [bioreactor metagenome]|uniref:dUTP diphosphatase n=1 Tax=bioreactor metagenome TaxID=1076179 RepID=A0A644Y0R4_9ZZZZ
MKLKIKAVSPLIGTAIPAPFYASPGAAAMDLHAAVDTQVEIGPGGLCSVPTGIAIALPSAEYVALVFARSGLATRHGIALSNGVGVVDSDYRGEIKVGLVNLSDKLYTVLPGDRIAQLAVVPVERAELELVSELDETERGTGGFGSTGR